eukprot:maker-scaffold_5-augustus-gene-1.66-mRNA-1 protein AED:0.44 eAED:0.45 QI:0/0/0/1/1/1/2/0/134
MAVNGVFSVTDQGTTVSGRNESGIAKAGDPLEIIGEHGIRMHSLVDRVEMFRAQIEVGKARSPVDLQLCNTEKESINTEIVISMSDTAMPHSKLKAEVYMLSAKGDGIELLNGIVLIEGFRFTIRKGVRIVGGV